MSSTRRISTLPRPYGTVHVGWQRVLAALRGAGLARELDHRTLRSRLGVGAEHAPTRDSVFALLEGYYRGDDEFTAGSRRRGQDRWIAVLADEAVAARQIVARIAAVLPELGPMAFVEEKRDGVSRLVLRVAGSCAEVDPEEVEEERIGASESIYYARRTVTVDALVAAANDLLAQRGATFRLLPLDGPGNAAAFVAVEPAGAAMLDAVGAWAPPLDQLDEFTAWPSGTFTPRAKAG